MHSYLDTSESEISKLKLELMESSTKSSISNHSIKDYQQLKIEELANSLEENIRNSLRIELGWKEDRRHFFYKKVEPFKIFKTHYIKNNEKQTVVLGSEKYILDHYYDTSFSIYNEQKEFNLKKSQHGVIMKETLFPVIVSLAIEIEMDGFYKINFFDISLFDENEVKIIFNNVKKMNKIHLNMLLLK